MFGLNPQSLMSASTFPGGAAICIHERSTYDISPAGHRPQTANFDLFEPEDKKRYVYNAFASGRTTNRYVCKAFRAGDSGRTKTVRLSDILSGRTKTLRLLRSLRPGQTNITFITLSAPRAKNTLRL